MTSSNPRNWWPVSFTPNACFGDDRFVADDFTVQQLDGMISNDDSDAENCHSGTRHKENYQQGVSFAPEQRNKRMTAASETMSELTNTNARKYATSSFSIDRRTTTIIGLDITNSESFDSEPMEIEVVNLNKDVAKKIQTIDKALEEVAKARALFEKKHADVVKKQSVILNHEENHERAIYQQQSRELERKAKLHMAKEKLKKKSILPPNPRLGRNGNSLQQKAAERRRKLKKELGLSGDGSIHSCSTLLGSDKSFYTNRSTGSTRSSRSRPSKSLKKKSTKAAYRL